MNRHGHRIGCLVITALISGGAQAAVIGLGNYALVEAEAGVGDDHVRFSTSDSAATGSPGSIFGGDPVFVATTRATKSALYGGQVATARAANSIDLANSLGATPPAFRVSGSQHAEGIRCADPVFCVSNAFTETELHLFFRVADAPEDVTFTYSYLMGYTGDRDANSTFGEARLLYDAGFELPGQTALFSFLTFGIQGGVFNPSGATTVNLPVGYYHFSFLSQAISEGLGGSASSDYALDLRFGPTPVPLPAAAWLMISGLGGVAAFARRRRSPEVHAAMMPA